MWKKSNREKNAPDQTKRIKIHLAVGTWHTVEYNRSATSQSNRYFPSRRQIKSHSTAIAHSHGRARNSHIHTHKARAHTHIRRHVFRWGRIWWGHGNSVSGARIHSPRRQAESAIVYLLHSRIVKRADDINTKNVLVRNGIIIRENTTNRTDRTKWHGTVLCWLVVSRFYSTTFSHTYSCRTLSYLIRENRISVRTHTHTRASCAFVCLCME